MKNALELINLRAEGGQCAEIMEGVDPERIREYNDILKQGVQANGISSERGKGVCKGNVEMGSGSICAMSKCCLRSRVVCGCEVLVFTEFHVL